MHRIYDWIKIIFKEKVNTFIKGSLGGCFISGVLLFDSAPINNVLTLILTVVLKIILIVVSGFLSGFVTVAGNDAYKWVQKKRAARKSNNRKNGNIKK